MAGRPWWNYEREAVARFYGRVPTDVLADRLGRSVKSVYLMAVSLGVTKPKGRTLAKVTAAVRRRHPLGWTDADIAKEANCDRRWVSTVRGRLGLPPNRGSEHYRGKVRAKTREQLERDGLRSLAELRREVFRRRARAAGWPDDLGPGHIRVLNLLWDHGPQTRKQLAAGFYGREDRRPSRRWFKSNDAEGSYTAHLLARGLIVSLGRVGAGGKGIGGGSTVYSLPLTIERGEVA